MKQMIETGAMNDNEIVVKRGLGMGGVVYLTPPADKSGIRTETIPGLKPITAPTAGGDTAKSVKMVTPPGPMPMPAPATAAPAPAKPKG